MSSELLKHERLMGCKVLVPKSNSHIDLKECVELWGALPEEAFLKAFLEEKGFSLEEAVVWINVKGIGSLTLPLTPWGDWLSALESLYN